MNPEAQQIAIAQACGWTWQEGTKPTYGGTNIPRGWINPKSKRCVIDAPDYLNDLNAMHVAEKVLTIHNWAAYEIELCDVLQRAGTDPDIWHHVLCATAPQRAEAFLRTIGKWKEEE